MRAEEVREVRVVVCCRGACAPTRRPRCPCTWLCVLAVLLAARVVEGEAVVRIACADTQGADTGRPAAAAAAAAATPRLARVCAAGYLGGLAKYLVVQPLDTMTTLFEISRAQHGAGGLVAAMQARVAEKGLPSLLSGLKSTVMLALPYAIVFHSAQTMASDWSAAALGERDRRMHTQATPGAEQRRAAISNLWGSCVGSSAASCIGVPMENLKHRGTAVLLSASLPHTDTHARTHAHTLKCAHALMPARACKHANTHARAHTNVSKVVSHTLAR